MFYYNLGYHFKLRDGSPSESFGSTIQASAMVSEQLVRRPLRKLSHLRHRLFDPQLYLAKLDNNRAESVVRNLSTYPWFSSDEAPAFDSSVHTIAEWQIAVANVAQKSWTRTVPTDPEAVYNATRAAIALQIQLGCEAIILPGPLSDSPREAFTQEAQWLDAGIAAAKELRVRLPIFATVALTDSVLKGSDVARYGFLETVSGNLAAREEIAGAYLVVEQSSEDVYCCTVPETLRTILLLTDDLVRGAGKRVIVNYAGAFGAIAFAAGASVWCSGYYRSLRRLRLVDFEDAEGRAYPRYYSRALLGDISLESDMDALAASALREAVLTETDSARMLNAALRQGVSVASVPDWAYTVSNLGAAMPHYNEVMLALGKHLQSLDQDRRVDLVQRLLEASVSLAERFRDFGATRSDVSHQAIWLKCFAEWRTRSGA